MQMDPTFKAIFGAQWGEMPQTLQNRYANRPHTNDKVIVDGVLNVYVSRWIKFLSPLLRLCGALVPYAGTGIPVTVCFESEPKSNAVWFKRTFNFQNRMPYRFISKLVPVGEDQVIEFMRFGLGCQMRYCYEDGKSKLIHSKYIWKIGKITLPLPLQFVLGRGYADEKPTGHNSFDMYFEIIHPLFGKVFGYDGKFKITGLPE